MEVKAIDYFNPPICESVILMALHSTGESLMGLSAACLRPHPIQLTFNWNRPGAGPRRGAATSLLLSGATDSPNPLSPEYRQFSTLIRYVHFWPIMEEVFSATQSFSLF